MCLWNSFPPLATSQKSYFYFGKGHKVIDLVIWKAIISGVCMPNIKSVSYCSKVMGKFKSWTQTNRTKTICPKSFIPVAWKIHVVIVNRYIDVVPLSVIHIWFKFRNLLCNPTIPPLAVSCFVHYLMQYFACCFQTTVSITCQNLRVDRLCNECVGSRGDVYKTSKHPGLLATLGWLSKVCMS